MKKTLCLSVFIIFIISIISCNNQTPTKEQSSVSENKIKVDYELQEQCGKQSEERFKNNYNSEHSMYQNHYNKKLNKCFILVRIFKQNFKSLFDVNENKQYGIFFPNIDGNSSCSVFEKKCNSEQEWDKLVKPYMEE